MVGFELDFFIKSPTTPSLLYQRLSSYGWICWLFYYWDNIYKIKINMTYNVKIKIYVFILNLHIYENCKKSPTSPTSSLKHCYIKALRGWFFIFKVQLKSNRQHLKAMLALVALRIMWIWKSPTNHISIWIKQLAKIANHLTTPIEVVSNKY